MAIKKKEIRTIAYWSIFILASLTLTLKILEVSSAQTLRIIVKYPDSGQYSYLVQNGYLLER
jgi:hypothetical protein